MFLQLWLESRATPGYWPPSIFTQGARSGHGNTPIPRARPFVDRWLEAGLVLQKDKTTKQKIKNQLCPNSHLLLMSRQFFHAPHKHINKSKRKARWQFCDLPLKNLTSSNHLFSSTSLCSRNKFSLRWRQLFFSKLWEGVLGSAFSEWKLWEADFQGKVPGVLLRVCPRDKSLAVAVAKGGHAILTSFNCKKRSFKMGSFSKGKKRYVVVVVVKSTAARLAHCLQGIRVASFLMCPS